MSYKSNDQDILIIENEENNINMTDNQIIQFKRKISI